MERRENSAAYIILADGFETIEALTPLDVLRRCGVEVTTISLNQTSTVRSSHGITVEADTTMQEFLLHRTATNSPSGSSSSCNSTSSNSAGTSSMSGSASGNSEDTSSSSGSASGNNEGTSTSCNSTDTSSTGNSASGSNTSGTSAHHSALILPGGYPGYKNLCSSPETGALIKEFYTSGELVCAICGAPTALKTNQISKGATITCHTSVKEELSDYYSIIPSAVVKYMNIITGMGAGRSLEFALAIAKELTSEEKVEEIKSKMEII